MLLTFQDKTNDASERHAIRAPLGAHTYSLFDEAGTKQGKLDDFKTAFKALSSVAVIPQLHFAGECPVNIYAVHNYPDHAHHIGDK